jgi:protein O-mannosyl-transferase
LLFIIHPVNVASVAWIAERKNTLSAALFFGSFYLFLRHAGAPSRSRYLAAIGLFLLAELSKGAVVTMPLALVASVLWMNRTFTRRDLVQIAPFAVIAVIVSVLTVHYQAAAPNYGLESSRFVFRIARAGCLPWVYIFKLILPVGLSPISPTWQCGPR